MTGSAGGKARRSLGRSQRRSVSFGRVSKLDAAPQFHPLGPKRVGTFLFCPMEFGRWTERSVPFRRKSSTSLCWEMAEMSCSGQAVHRGLGVRAAVFRGCLTSSQPGYYSHCRHGWNTPQKVLDCRRDEDILDTCDRSDRFFAVLPRHHNRAFNVRSTKTTNTSERSDGLAVFANCFRQADPFGHHQVVPRRASAGNCYAMHIQW